jgi:hypothetical protein
MIYFYLPPVVGDLDDSVAIYSLLLPSCKFCEGHYSRHEIGPLVDVSYAAPQVHGIVNIALHREYSLGIVFIFSHGKKDLYHV